ncbi:MAG: hypothetical protein H6Q55_2817, partial [Deltaproteobacteria bacterium]|nr:hypothetical protein [Deltaproteobacteria bacterium]
QFSRRGREKNRLVLLEHSNHFPIRNRAVIRVVPEVPAIVITQVRITYQQERFKLLFIDDPSNSFVSSFFFGCRKHMSPPCDNRLP